MRIGRLFMTLLKSTRLITSIIAVALSTVALGACQTYSPAFKSVAETSKIERSTAYYSYVATDRLIRQARPSVSIDTPLLVGTLHNINKMETSTALGRMIAEQISTRLVQRGHQVAELKLRNSVNIQDTKKGAETSGEFLLSRDVRAIAGEHKAAAIVSGTYAVAETKVLINVKIVDVAIGSIIASTDYTIPKTPDVEALLGSGGGVSFFGKPLAY